eukprot:2866649-Alexandrium_andersonii.AAC.1
MQSAIRSRPVGAAIHLNPQSASRSMHYGFTRSDLELRGPRSGLSFDRRSSRDVPPARLSERIPSRPTCVGSRMSE